MSETKEPEDLRQLLVEYAGISRREGVCALRGLPDQPGLVTHILDSVCLYHPEENRMHALSVRLILRAIDLMLQGKRADEVEDELVQLSANWRM